MKPILSICTISKNEIRYISDWFNDVDQQDFRHMMEVIVCDSSNDGTERVVDARANKPIFEQAGYARARNLCAKEAEADVFLFTDVDMRYPSKSFLFDALQYFESHAMQIAGIKTVLQPDNKDETYNFIRDALIATLPPGLTGQFMMMTKQAYEHVAGFDELFPFWEDINMALKMRHNGYAIHLLPFTIKHLREQKKHFLGVM